MVVVCAHPLIAVSDESPKSIGGNCSPHHGVVAVPQAVSRENASPCLYSRSGECSFENVAEGSTVKGAVDRGPIEYKVIRSIEARSTMPPLNHLARSCGEGRYPDLPVFRRSNLPVLLDGPCNHKPALGEHVPPLKSPGLPFTDPGTRHSQK